MRVLVTAASKHGATAEIAGAIADELRLRGHEAVHLPLGEASVEEFDAVVVGSAVYIGHWLKGATQFVRHNQAALRVRRVWLFSSGPVGNLPRPDEPAVDVAKVERMTAAAGHVVFGGRLNHDKLTFGEKAILSALRAPEGDFRDWAAIRSWAGFVADDLHSVTTAAR
jgi:menaquinone-dependent protoporphyrinogen oxidase